MPPIVVITLARALGEELRYYYEGRHMSHLRPHSHRREKERKPQEA